MVGYVYNVDSHLTHPLLGTITLSPRHPPQARKAGPAQAITANILKQLIYLFGLFLTGLVFFPIESGVGLLVFLAPLCSLEFAWLGYSGLPAISQISLGREFDWVSTSQVAVSK